MTLKIKHNLYPGTAQPKPGGIGDARMRVQIYNKFYDLLVLFYDHPSYTVQTISVGISYKIGYKRYYNYMLTCSLKSEDDIRLMLNILEEKCIRKDIEFDSIDRIFLNVILDKDRV